MENSLDQKMPCRRRKNRSNFYSYMPIWNIGLKHICIVKLRILSLINHKNDRFFEGNGIVRFPADVSRQSPTPIRTPENSMHPFTR